MEKELKPEESLKIIQNMIIASQQQFANNGIFMIVWAIVLILAALANYLIIASGTDGTTINRWLPVIWVGFTILGGIISLAIGFRQSKRKTVETHIGKILKWMWLGFGVVLFFTILFPILNNSSPIPFILTLTAFAVYIFALTIRYLPFMIGASCILILGALSFWTNYELQLVAFALAIFLGYLIPGIMLYRKYNSRK